ncbi:helix-turn-helix transcriptional regulator, partial [Candidatus Poribacteria bacterium]|nr:helix-turn-helix transcriptional regulator [Candidatus Poribacteria bacterium]
MTTQSRQQNGISMILEPSGQMKEYENEMPRTRSEIDQHFNPTLLKHFRKQKYRTQKDFAAVLGVSLTTITNWETGKRKPTHKLLMKITEVLEIETSDLLCETGKMIFRLWEEHLLDYLHSPPDRL